MAAYSELDNKPQQLSVRTDRVIEGERKVKGKNNWRLSEKRQHWTAMDNNERPLREQYVPLQRLQRKQQ